MEGSKSRLEKFFSIKILAILALFVLPATPFERALDKAKIDGVDTHDLDIFIERKVKYLHSKIDIKPAIVGLLALEKCVNQLEKGNSDSLEMSMSRNLQKKVNRIAAKLYRLTGKNYISQKSKRSIEFIGDLISDLFGNPGPADWKQVNSNILALDKALKKIENNAEINHADIDTDRHIIEQHNRELKTLSLITNRNQNELSNISNELRGLKTFIEISALSDTLDSLANALLEIKNVGMRGMCSDRALDKDFLVENIQTLEANKVGIAPVFGSWEWRNYYRFEMCTLAMVKEALWLTIRIPLVKKAERLVRVIPTFHLKRAIERADLYGIKTMVFREKDNEQYHLMTQSTFDLCNVLGNTRTCGTRDFRFNAQSQVIAIEFMMDRFLVISNKLKTIKITEKCNNAVREFELELDSVMLTPTNCSYSASSFNIDIREADLEVTKEVGLVSIDKLEISKIENFHDNITRVFIESIANRSSAGIFDKNKLEINEAISEIDTKHNNSWSMYNLEKWVVIGGIMFLVALYLLMKVRSSFSSRKIRRTTFNEIAELRDNLRHTQAEFRQETITLQEMNNINRSVECENVGQQPQQIEPKSVGSAINFSSPLNRSQFLQNC